MRIPTRLDFAGGWSDVRYFSEREGGAVLNAAINQYVEGSARWDENGLRLEYHLALPADSHLGSSASIDVAWLSLTNQLVGRRQDAGSLAESAYRLEKLLGVEGGKQDQYAAALGGINVLRFGAEDATAQVERLHVPQKIVRALEDRLVLCYSGAAQSAGSVHERVWQRYRQGDEGIARLLRQSRDSVDPARDALLAGDFARLAEVLTFNRETARQLDTKNISQRMDRLFAAGHTAGALGSKPCGEGSGGFLLFLCAEGKRRQVEDALLQHAATVLPFEFAPLSD